MRIPRSVVLHQRRGHPFFHLRRCNHFLNHLVPIFRHLLLKSHAILQPLLIDDFNVTPSSRRLVFISLGLRGDQVRALVLYQVGRVFPPVVLHHALQLRSHGAVHVARDRDDAAEKRWSLIPVHRHQSSRPRARDQPLERHDWFSHLSRLVVLDGPRRRRQQHVEVRTSDVLFLKGQVKRSH